MTAERTAVVLVYSTSHALKAEKAVKRAGIACKLIPVPRHLSSDCGICLRFPLSQQAAVEGALAAGRIEYEQICAL